MKYLILIYSNPKSMEVWDNFSAEQRAAGLAGYQTIYDDLAGSGELISAAALADPSLSKHVRIEDGRSIPTDGPFAEVKEHLAGFFFVECPTIDRALEWAARFSRAFLGSVEVRPTMAPGGGDV
jgi:hypothetical protein